MAEIMTTKEVSEYLRLHEITICKYAKEGKIPAIRVGHVWRYDKEVIDNWLAEGPNVQEVGKGTGVKKQRKSTGRIKSSKQ